MDPFAGLVPETAYRPAVLFELPYGVVAGACYSRGEVPSSVLYDLHDMDRSVAEARPTHQAGPYVAGRLALRCALEHLGAGSLALAPLVPSDSGAVTPPLGFVASLSHKDGVSVAIAAGDNGQRVGIDLESMTPSRPVLTDRILAPEERIEMASVTEGDLWLETLARFCIKEATYKAISDFVGPAEVGFKEISVRVPRRVRAADGFQQADVSTIAPWGSGLRLTAMVALYGSRLVAVSAAYRWGGRGGGSMTIVD